VIGSVGDPLGMQEGKEGASLEWRGQGRLGQGKGRSPPSQQEEFDPLIPGNAL